MVIEENGKRFVHCISVHGHLCNLRITIINKIQEPLTLQISEELLNPFFSFHYHNHRINAVSLICIFLSLHRVYKMQLQRKMLLACYP